MHFDLLRLLSAGALALFLAACPPTGSGYDDDDATGDDDDAADDDDASDDDDTVANDDDTAPDDDDTTGPECTTHAVCEDDEFCHQQNCELIFGRIFEVHFASASTSTNDAAGDPWDAFGGLPDPYGEVTLDDVQVLATPTEQDSLQATWSAAADVTLTATSVCVLVYDDDELDDDLIDGSCWNGLDSIVSLVRAGGHDGALFEGLADVDVRVTPTF